MNKRLSYLIGVFLGDGSIDHKRNVFTLQCIDEDFADTVYDAILSTSAKRPIKVLLNRRTTADNKVFRVQVYDKDLCSILLSMTNGRKNIPIEFGNWSKELQHSLIAGLLDSEGYVSIGKRHFYGGHEVFDMRIGIGATDQWIYELHAFLQQNGYRIGVITRELLKSKKVFARFCFNKKDFINKGLYFTVKRKQDRIHKYKVLFPGSTTTRNLPNTKETRVKKSLANQGRNFSEETRLKMSDAARVRVKRSKRNSLGKFVSGNDIV